MNTTLSRMHARRVLKLVDFLRKLHRKNFDIKYWAMQDECGTVCCAAGWAGMIPSFRKAGLRTSLKSGSVILYDGTEPIAGGIVAICKFLGFEPFYAHALIFLDRGYENNPTPKQVAKRLSDIVKTRNAAEYGRWLNKRKVT